MKSFNAPHKVGREGNETVLGRYTPTIDSIALLADIDVYNSKDPIKEILNSKDPLEKAVLYHEFRGHVALTKKSSFWGVLFTTNFSSFILFTRMLHIIKADLAQTKMERLKKDARDLILFKEIDGNLHNSWRPLQETIANVYLSTIKKDTDNIDLKSTIDSLIAANNPNSRVIRDLTRIANFILDELGNESGWPLIANLAFEASSPNYYKEFLNQTPKNMEDIRKIKRNAMEKIQKERMEDPRRDDPTVRFIEMIVVAEKCTDEIKRSLKRGISPKELSLNIVSFCGLETMSLENQTNLMINQIKIMANKEIIPDEGIRGLYAETGNFLNIFKTICKEDAPIHWFINDIKTGKIIFTSSSATRNHTELPSFLFTEIFKYQFLKSLENNEDCIDCFENKVSLCRSDCESCKTNNGVKLVKELYRVIEGFSYDDLRREALDIDRVRGSIIR